MPIPNRGVLEVSNAHEIAFETAGLQVGVLLREFPVTTAPELDIALQLDIALRRSPLQRRVSREVRELRATDEPEVQAR